MRLLAHAHACVHTSWPLRSKRACSPVSVSAVHTFARTGAPAHTPTPACTRAYSLGHTQAAREIHERVQHAKAQEQAQQAGTPVKQEAPEAPSTPASAGVAPGGAATPPAAPGAARPNQQQQQQLQTATTVGTSVLAQAVQAEARTAQVASLQGRWPAGASSAGAGVECASRPVRKERVLPAWCVGWGRGRAWRRKQTKACTCVGYMLGGGAGDMCVCVRACVRSWVRACYYAKAHVRVRVCVCARLPATATCVCGPSGLHPRLA